MVALISLISVFHTPCACLAWVDIVWCLISDSYLFEKFYEQSRKFDVEEYSNCFSRVFASFLLFSFCVFRNQWLSISKVGSFLMFCLLHFVFISTSFLWFRLSLPVLFSCHWPATITGSHFDPWLKQPPEAVYKKRCS